ncbi:MAG TPA: [protein-PII] uridylyltransferase [Candidatus Hydrogenedentes bacterium]|nr:[protein-PII] uridylyltransferase [Candidatus Hydrogenedentota bacterium]
MTVTTVDIAELSRLAREDIGAFRAVPRATCITVVREYAQMRRNEIRARHDAAESGSATLRHLTQLCDDVVRVAATFAVAHTTNPQRIMQQIAVCALGGYGRREMSPYSDLDISLVLDNALTADVETLNAFLLPFFCDIGFKAGYTLHTVREAVALAAADPQVFTTYSQARLIHGDNTTFGRLKLLLADLDMVNREAVLAYVRRREHPELLPPEHRDLYALEPNIKENAGGLRDFHAGLWMIMLMQGALSLDELAQGGYITAVEHLELLEGLDFLWRIRNELHFHTGREEDQLTFSLQKHVARAFGYGDSPQSVARFMEDYYNAACHVRRFLQIAARICDQPSMARLFEQQKTERSQFTVYQYQHQLCVDPSDKNWFAENPARMMEVVWESARRAVPLSLATSHWLSNNLGLVNEEFRTSDAVRHYFLAICKRPMKAGAALREAARAGLLAAYIPEFGAVRGVMRYEDFHSYPVDEHTLRALEALANLSDAAVPLSDILYRALERVREPHVLVLSILFHDLGKAAGEVHIEEGARIAQAVAQRIGLDEYETEQMALLVRHHQAMSDIAFYRDTDELETIAAFAALIKNDDLLRMLLLITYADLSAVGPNVYNEWKGALLLKLFLRTERMLTGRDADNVDQAFTAPKIARIRELAGDIPPAELDGYLDELGERYLLGYTPEQIIEHVGCLAEARRTGLATRCIERAELGVSEYVVCTRDRHGLFAEIAGAFSSQLINVRNAALFTREDGWVVDSFLVHNATSGRPLTENETAGVTHVLEDVIQRGVAISKYVDKARKRLFALTRSAVPVRPSVEFDNDASRTDTVIDIVAGDRTGLLYDIAHTLSEMGMDFNAAHIVTDVGRARDAFYVRMNDRKLEDGKLKEWAARRLYEAIAGPALLEKP